MSGLPRRVARAVVHRARRLPVTARGRAVRRARAADRRAAGRAAVPRVSASAEAVSDGVVEVLEWRQVAGWVDVAPGAPPVWVGLYINDYEVMGVWSTPDPNRHGTGEIRSFRFTTADFWNFAKKSDVVTVRVAGKTLPIAGKGAFHRPGREGKESIATLQQRMARGEVFTSQGRMRLSKRVDYEWQAGVLALYNAVREVVRESFGYEAFLIYGTLLGAVRDGGFIGHDIDFDAAYVSKHTDGADAGRELSQIAFALIEKGFYVESRVIVLHIYDPKHPHVRIDLFHLFFNDDGVLRFPWGIAGTTQFRSAQWEGTKEIDLAGSRAAIPEHAEALLATIYGDTWQTPNPGFSWSRDRTEKAPEGRVPRDAAAAVYWANLYTHTSFSGPSSFAELVAARADLPQVVVDLGCGEARDAIALARAGKRVVGIDYSDVAVRNAKRNVQRAGLGSRVNVVLGDLADGQSLKTAVAAARGDKPDQPVLFYARFLLHAITAPTETAIMAALDEVARPGDVLAAEFRTLTDGDRPKVYTRPIRRFIDAAAFEQQLTDRYGFSPLVQQAGTGFSPYQSEDPHLYRLIARRETADRSAE
jgi:SAM-dependent methyltransferase